jgi:uncharacterized protein (DUF58 family)
VAASRTTAGAAEDDDAALLDGETVRVLKRLSLVSLDAIVAGVTGQRAGPAGGVGLEFADYRPYAPGDDMRWIDWNVYQRLREVLVKVAPAEGHIEIDLLIDSSRSMDFGAPNKLGHARRIAAALGTVGLLRSDTVRAWSLSDGGAEAGGRVDAPGMLLILADEVQRLPAGRGTDLAASLRAYRRGAQPTDLTILISDAMVAPDQLAQSLAELSSAARATGFVHVIDNDEAAPRQRGPVELRDQETGQRVELTLTATVYARYQERFERFCRAVREACEAARVTYVRAPTDVSVLDLLSESARVAGLVRL